MPVGRVRIHQEEHKRSTCPTCGKVIDAATSHGSAPRGPRGGDFGACWGCGQILRYNADLSIRASSLDEVSEHSPELVRKLEQYLKMIKTRRQ